MQEGNHLTIKSGFMVDNKNQNRDKIGLGGGCHWCTEGIFQSLIGVHKVDQGWISSKGSSSDYSEAVIVHYHKNQIDLKTLIEIHLLTHSSASNHSMRNKYRSAIYTFIESQTFQASKILEDFQQANKHIITKVLPFKSFQLNKEDQLNYLYSQPDRPFCTTYIHPKLHMLMKNHSKNLDSHKLQQIGY